MGEISRATPQPVRPIDFSALLERCKRRTQYFDEEDHHPHLDFGDRWRVLKEVMAGDREAVSKFEFDQPYISDLDNYKLHPALMDMATAGAQVIMEDYDPVKELFVPVGCGVLTILGEIKPVALAHVRYHKGKDVNHALYDVDLCDEQGNIVVTVRNYELQRVDRIVTGEPSTQVDKDSLANLLSNGISNDEGREILKRLLKSGSPPQVIVVPTSIETFLEQVRTQSGPERPELKEDEHDADADPDIETVEATFLAHEAIDAAVVRSFLAEDQTRRLIAFYRPEGNQVITVSEMRKLARERLDSALVPQHYVEVHEFARTTEGDVDRSQFLDPFAPVDNYIAPVTSTEKQIARVWEDLLGIKRVSRNDNFFDIGGHSLLSVRAIVRIEKKIGIQLDQGKMALMTLEQIADDIDKLTGDSDNNEDTEIPEVAKKSRGLGSWLKRKK